MSCSLTVQELVVNSLSLESAFGLGVVVGVLIFVGSIGVVKVLEWMVDEGII